MQCFLYCGQTCYIYIILESISMFVLWNQNCNFRCQPLLYLIFFHQLVKNCCVILFRPERLRSIWRINCCSKLVLLGKLVTHQNVLSDYYLWRYVKKYAQTNITSLLCHSCANVICNRIRQCERWTQSKH
jgi:hypothetical protein